MNNWNKTEENILMMPASSTSTQNDNKSSNILNFAWSMFHSKQRNTLKIVLVKALSCHTPRCIKFVLRIWPMPLGERWPSGAASALNHLVVGLPIQPLNGEC